MSENCKKKFQHEKCTILLDDCFCNDDVAALLSDAGFATEQFTTHFPRTVGRAGVREQGVKDHRVIALSHKLKMVVFTADHKMCNDHAAEFMKYPNAMVVATASKAESDEVWANAFIQAKLKIERLHKKQGRPWFAKINQKGDVTTCKTFIAA